MKIENRKYLMAVAILAVVVLSGVYYFTIKKPSYSLTNVALTVLEGQKATPELTSSLGFSKEEGEKIGRAEKEYFSEGQGVWPSKNYFDLLEQLPKEQSYKICERGLVVQNPVDCYRSLAIVKKDTSEVGEICAKINKNICDSKYYRTDVEKKACLKYIDSQREMCEMFIPPFY